jgi:hypothetical protein
MEHSVTALHPCSIRDLETLDKAEYEIVRNSILKNLLAYGAMTCEQLGSLVESHLRKKFHGSLWRHYSTVLDMLGLQGEVFLDWNADPPLIELNSA